MKIFKKAILVTTAILLLATGLSAGLRTTTIPESQMVMGVKFNSLGGSVYIGSLGELTKCSIGIGQFKNKLAVDITIKYMGGLGISYVINGIGSDHLTFNTATYLNYKDLEFGITNRWQLGRYKPLFVSDFQGYFGLDRTFQVNSDFILDVSEINIK